MLRHLEGSCDVGESVNWVEHNEEGIGCKTVGEERVRQLSDGITLNASNLRPSCHPSAWDASTAGIHSAGSARERGLHASHYHYFCTFAPAFYTAKTNEKSVKVHRRTFPSFPENSLLPSQGLSQGNGGNHRRHPSQGVPQTLQR